MEEWRVLLKSSYKDAIFELEQEKERRTMTFSSVSMSSLVSYLEAIDCMVLEEKDDILPSSTVSITPFKWQGKEEDETERAMKHLAKELKKVGIKFGRGNFWLYDVHAQESILSVDDEKTGKLSGGTDLILAPFGIAKESVVRNACVIFELKTAEAVEANGFDSFSSQATLELIATCYHSNQLPLVVLTDLHCGSYLYTLSRDSAGRSINIKKYLNVPLNKMVTFVSNHLSTNCVPKKDYRIPGGDVEAEAEYVKTVSRFKELRVTPKQLSFSYERFHEELEDTPAGSRERARVIQSFFSSQGLPSSSYLSYFV